ncbi:hypothetical protein G9A89_020693 [Geosiphon pyriformis]|nr:hypothetical protein G9A89_020693 [Geosiphon pyriformis]
MIYAPIAILEKFTGKEDNTQVWLNDIEKAIVANEWNDARAILVNKPQDFNAFKIEFLRYFSNNNSINRLANTFTTIKQEENKAIQAIDANYFTFICGLCSSILQNVHPIYPVDLQAAITNTRDFEATELEANHAQAVNLVMNGATPSELHIYDAAANLSTTSISSTNLSTNNTNNLSTIGTTHLSAADTQPNNPETKQQLTLTSNILSATITKNETLNAIFLFKLEKTTPVLLFSGATFNTKLITAMYINTKIDSHTIKLILDNGSADSIITKQLIDQLGHQVDCAASTRIITANGATKTPIGEIDDFPFETLVGNDWLSKTNTILDWITQKLQLSQNSRHTRVLATCGHFKPINSTTPLIEFKEEEKKPTWEAYQVFWANTEHNELPPILLWDDNSKGKQSKELIWKADQA